MTALLAQKQDLRARYGYKTRESDILALFLLQREKDVLTEADWAEPLHVCR